MIEVKPTRFILQVVMSFVGYDVVLSSIEAYIKRGMVQKSSPRGRRTGNAELLVDRAVVLDGRALLAVPMAICLN